MDWQHFQKIDSYLPIDLFTIEGFFLAHLVMIFFILARYFGLVSIPYFLFWRSRSGDVFGFRKLHDQEVLAGQIRGEIFWSIVSSFIFSFSGYVMGLFWQMGWSQVYLQFDFYGFWYLPLSFVLLALIHEVYFYFTHVWMHRPSLYRRIHRVHHQSVKTSPWASFSFHPLETIVHALFLPVVILVLPLHPLVIIAYLTFMTLTAISNHLGVELIPSRWLRRFFISGGHHSLHHQKFNCNFGLYFTFLDHLFATEWGDRKEKIGDEAGAQMPVEVL